MKFGLYFIPYETNFYAKGSRILGYDIYNKRVIPHPSVINKHWVHGADIYGFHMTITDAVEVKQESLSKVVSTVQNTLDIFKKKLIYDITLQDIGFWESDSTQARLKFLPNNNLLALHCVLVSLVQSLGLGSKYTSSVASGNHLYTADQLKKINQFNSPYIFENFVPHFTFLDPFDGTESERSKVLNLIKSEFSDVKSMEITELCMVIKKDSERYYEIHQTFQL